MFLGVCTYDYTQNVLWHDVNINCVENMIKQLNNLAYKCIDKMKQNAEMEMDERDKLRQGKM